MADKTGDSALGAHQAFVEQLEQQLRQPASGKPPAAAMREDKERLLAYFQERLATTVAARERSIARYDEEIKRRKALVRTLEKEVGRKSAKPAAKRSRKRAAPRRKTKGREPDLCNVQVSMVLGSSWRTVSSPRALFRGLYTITT